MTVKLDSGICSFQKLDGKNEDLTLDIKKKKMETFTDTSALNAGLKEKITNTNKIIIAIDKIRTVSVILLGSRSSDYAITAMVQ
jgi:hypothetical protein